MPNREDYYEILGVDPAASTEEIRSAWRRKAMDLHPDRLNQASEAERYSAEEALKKANRAYEVLGNKEERRRYHADWLRSNVPPKPVVVPSVIVFNDAVPGDGKTGSFVIRNDGGAYSNIWFSDPGSWVTVTGYASLEPDDELPLRVEIRASGHDWGRHYTESIAVRLDGVEAAVRVHLRTKPVPVSHYTTAASATPRSTAFLAWGKLLGVAAAVTAIVMMIVTTITEQTGAPTINSRPPVTQPWSGVTQPWQSGSQPDFPGVQPGLSGTQPRYPGFQPGRSGFQQGFPSSLPGYPEAQPSPLGFQPRSPVMQPRSPGYRPSSPGFRPGFPGIRSSSPGFRSSSSGFRSSFPSFGR